MSSSSMLHLLHLHLLHPFCNSLLIHFNAFQYSAAWIVNCDSPWIPTVFWGFQREKKLIMLQNTGRHWNKCNIGMKWISIWQVKIYPYFLPSPSLTSRKTKHFSRHLRMLLWIILSKWKFIPISSSKLN